MEMDLKMDLVLKGFKENFKMVNSLDGIGAGSVVIEEVKIGILTKLIRDGTMKTVGFKIFSQLTIITEEILMVTGFQIMMIQIQTGTVHQTSKMISQKTLLNKSIVISQQLKMVD